MKLFSRLILFNAVIFSPICLAKNAFRGAPYDVTLVGQIKWAGGLERLPISLTTLLKSDLRINHIRTPGVYTFNEIGKQEQFILKNADKRPGCVSILFDVLWHRKETPARFVPNSHIKIAYSMLEGTAIPSEWVRILNSNFDSVVVPDPYYQSIYKNCGVTIPIFVLPHGILIENLLNRQASSYKPNNPFIFGSSATFIPRKNHSLLIEAFHEEFGNDPSVRLKIHGRLGGEFEMLSKKVAQYRTKNIQLIRSPFTTKEYEQFLSSLDCYVLVSKGEGFSITPREALALGKPCIISDNTAHRTIAQTGFVYAVPSNIAEPAAYEIFDNVGFNFNCAKRDVRKALREVYTHYESYVKKAREGREWVKQYLWSERKAHFLTLIKPKKVILGNENSITAHYLMTSSKNLYLKYNQLIGKE